MDRHARDELANSISHAVGLLLSVVGAGVLLTLAAEQGRPRHLLGASIYSATMVSVYAASTLSHAVQEPTWRARCRALDQGFIYLFIAGTFTPLSLIYLQGGWWWLLLTAMWAVALAGFLAKVVFRHCVDSVSLVLYLMLGWLPVIAAGPISKIVPAPILWSMLAGGLCYTVGTVFLLLDRRVLYFHCIWHLLVIAGTACHYWAVLTAMKAPPLGHSGVM